jgi:uncharacterized membrane protein required for colicin V production
METLQRIQPLDILFVVLWAAIVGWGLQTGLVRQLGMLVGVYGAAILAGTQYRLAGRGLAAAFGGENLAQLEFIAYCVLFAVAFGVIGLIIWRAYPLSRLSRGFGADNTLGAAVGAVWGILLLIALLTILRFYTVLPWADQETTQSSVLGQIQSSQLAPVLQVVTSPLWQVMVPWFPTPVNARL